MSANEILEKLIHKIAGIMSNNVYFINEKVFRQEMVEIYEFLCLLKYYINHSEGKK